MEEVNKNTELDNTEKKLLELNKNILYLHYKIKKLWKK
jgi:hypothetical protein